MNKAKFDSLKPEYQKILLEEAAAAATFQRKLNADNEAAAIAQLRAKGMQVNGTPGCSEHQEDRQGRDAPALCAEERRCRAACLSTPSAESTRRLEMQTLPLAVSHLDAHHHLLAAR
ncbi:hypothetical protein ACU4GD_32265 [Cupriavidus basilensis]